MNMPLASGENQMTEQIQSEKDAVDILRKLPETYNVWAESIQSVFIEIAGRQQEENLQPEHCWWYPWKILRPFFELRGYTLFHYDPQDPSAVPFAEGPPAFDSFGLYGERNPERMLRTSFENSSKAYGARDRQNRDVAIKVVDKYSSENAEGSTELQILKFLNSPTIRRDPRNTTITVLEFLDYHDWKFVIMPFQDGCNAYPFLTSQECLEFACQVLDALAFLHEHRIAHLDVSHENIVMNFHGAPPPRFYFKGDEFFDVDPLPEFRSTFPVKYSLMDFGNSAYFLPGLKRSQCLVKPTGLGRPHRAPEVNGRFKYDPFAADVYQTARFFYSVFGRIIYPEVPGLVELLQDMSSVYPPDRISMASAASRMRLLHGSLLSRSGLCRGVIECQEYYPIIPRPWRRYYFEQLKNNSSQAWKTILTGCLGTIIFDSFVHFLTPSKFE